MKLQIKNPDTYVKAVSGLFITSKTPTGLTPTEIKIISRIMEYSGGEDITFSVRRKIMDEFGFKRQTFYNMVVVLKRKGAIVDNRLHKIFSSGKLLINYANSKEDN